jgi:hypothetical protein
VASSSPEAATVPASRKKTSLYNRGVYRELRRGGEKREKKYLEERKKAVPLRSQTERSGEKEKVLLKISETENNSREQFHRHIQ